MREFGARLKAAKNAKRGSFLDLGQTCGVSGMTICLWTKGQGNPTKQDVEALARELCVDVEWLLRGRGCGVDLKQPAPVRVPPPPPTRKPAHLPGPAPQKPACSDCGSTIAVYHDLCARCWMAENR
jgi:transcriptional regulator with XRE-family HTH domain